MIRGLEKLQLLFSPPRIIPRGVIIHQVRYNGNRVSGFVDMGQRWGDRLTHPIVSWLMQGDRGLCHRDVMPMRGGDIAIRLDVLTMRGGALQMRGVDQAMRPVDQGMRHSALTLRNGDLRRQQRRHRFVSHETAKVKNFYQDQFVVR